MKKANWIVVLFAAVLASLVLAACGGSDDDSGDSGSGGGDTTAAEGGVPTEGGPDAGPIVFAHSASIPQVVKLPQTLAVEEMAKEGYDTDQQYMQTTTDSINAVLRGSATFGNTAPANFFSAVAGGADLVAIAGGGRPDYELVGAPGLEDICDADRLAINNPISTTDVLVRASTADCGGGDKEVLTIALTPNRINAMVEGQIDATPVQLSSVPQIDRDYAGKADLMANWAEEYPDTINTVTFVKESTLEERPKALYDFVAAQQKVIDQAYEDPASMVAATKRIVESVMPRDAKPAIDLYIKSQVFPRDGGLDESQVQETYQQLRDTGVLEEDLDPEEFVDRTFVDLVAGQGQSGGAG